MQSKNLVGAGSGEIELLNTIPHQNPKDSPLGVPTKDGHEDVEHKRLTNFLEIDRRIRRLESKDQRRDFHHAVSNGNIEVIDELLTACPESMKDVSASGDTLLHVAVKNNQVDGFRVLIKWIEMHNMRDIVNWPDCNGNTVLHIATSKKQLEIIKLLLNKGENGVGKILEVNAINSKGLSAMDILDTLDTVMEDPTTDQLRQILQRAGANRETSKGWFKYFKFQRHKDSPSDTRNALLVVAALIAAITFQAGVNLPTGILKLTDEINNNSTSIVNNNSTTSIFNYNSTSLNSAWRTTKFREKVKTYAFLFTNSAGLTSALSIIMHLTFGFPYQRELVIAMVCMVASYVFSITSITDTPWIAYILSGIALLLPLLLRLPVWGKAWNWWKKICRENETILKIRDYSGNSKQHKTLIC